MQNQRMTPREFSNKSQDEEIYKKQLELREREIALKEKEMALKFKAMSSNKNIAKESLSLTLIKLIGVAILLIAIFIAYNIVNKSDENSIIEDSLIKLGIQ